MKVFAKSIREGGEQLIPYRQFIDVAKSTFSIEEFLKIKNVVKIGEWNYVS